MRADPQPLVLLVIVIITGAVDVTHSRILQFLVWREKHKRSQKIIEVLALYFFAICKEKSITLAVS